MGLATSTAVRRDDAYGSLGGLGAGSFGAVERKLKKKPVLVLDPEELAKAHQLFQIGAAEQLGEFDPKERAFRPAAALFSPILGMAPRYDQDDDDYVAPADLVAELAADIGEADEESGDDLPPIDLNALLALTQAEQEAEDAFYREDHAPTGEWEPEFADEVVAETSGDIGFAVPEPETYAEAEPIAETVIAEAVPIEPAAETISPADALARIVGRAAAQPKPTPETEPQIVLPEPEPAPEPVFEAEPELVADEPHWTTDEPIEFAEFTEEPAETLDLIPQDEFDGEAFMHREAPLRVMPIMGAAGTRSNLRARLVREDLTLARPKPAFMRQMVIALRRLWRSLTV